MKNKNKYLSVRRDINIVNWLGLYTLYLKEILSIAPSGGV